LEFPFKRVGVEKPSTRKKRELKQRKKTQRVNKTNSKKGQEKRRASKRSEELQKCTTSCVASRLASCAVTPDA
jgi:hypothetical protein